MTEVNQLIAYARDYNIDITEEQASILIKHLDLVIKKNESINLTRILSREDALVLHLLDSIVLFKYFPDLDGKYMDMGTGAGFPGIALSYLSGRKSVLIDSVAKKIKCVNEFIDQLELQNATGCAVRLEEYASKHKNEFACITARALASLPVLIEYAAPFLCKGGYLVLTKGNPDEQELESGSKVAKICGMKLIQEDSFDLPNNLGHREILVYQKVANPSIKLPRQTGKAVHDPLA